MLQKLLWRADMFARKAAGFLPNVPWTQVRDMIIHRHHPQAALPKIQWLEQDKQAGMVLLQVGEHTYWYPSDASYDELAVVAGEVFDPNQGHHYEYRSARLRRGDVVCDAGACEGFFTRFALERGASVLAVEPWSRMADCLERTFAQQIAEGRVEVIRELLGSRPGEANLSVDLSFPFGASPSAQDEQRRLVCETVRIRTLDDVMRGSRFRRLDFLKMDIEGGEREALAGSARTIQRDHPRMSITTYHRADDWDALPRQVRTLAPEYCFAYKGLVEYPEGGLRPIMMHAWAGQL